MATTTNYGWTTPDDTALVKDGAAAIRTLGSSVDTTTKALNPSTTLGDIEYRSSTANTNTRLGIGSTGHILTVVAGVPAWSAPAGSGKVLQVVQKKIGDNVSESSTTTENTFLDNQDSGSNVLSLSITPSSVSSKILVIASCFTEYHTGAQGQAGSTFARILRGASSIFTDAAGWKVGYAYNGSQNRYGSSWNITYLDSPASTSSQTYKVQYSFSGAQTFYYGTNDTLTLMEIGA